MLPLVPLLLALAAADHPSGEWAYVRPPAGDPFEHPPLRALALSRRKPDDVVERVQYRGRRQRYAQLRYGSPSSTRVTFVLDENGPGNADLYVDANRNRRIEPRDKVEGHDGTWRLPLRIAIVEGEITHEIKRGVVVRLGATGTVLSAAAAGYVEGTVQLASRAHRARRTDGDLNGVLTDPQDGLWIDLNDDGRFDTATEQFRYGPIVAAGPDRYAVRSDEFGRRLALGPLTGAGTVRLVLRRPGLASRVTALSALLIGRDGSAVGLRGRDASSTVPAGDYRFGALTVELADPGGGPRWTFVFSDQGDRSNAVWHTVAKDGVLALDPIGTPVLSLGASACRPGEPVTLQPRLHTGDGLLIVTCDRGEPSASGGPAARVELFAGDRSLRESASSGFA